MALGVVTSTDPEILILDEGIGNVDAAFMRSPANVCRSWWSGRAFWCSRVIPNEFLAQLCDRALWIDHGRIRQEGGIEEVVGPMRVPRPRQVCARCWPT